MEDIVNIIKSDVMNQELINLISEESDEIKQLYLDTYIVHIADKALNGDDEDFRKYITLQNGYDHADTCLRGNICYNSLFNRPLEYIYGCRSPYSTSHWDGAFVVIKGEVFSVSYYEEGNDFSGKPPEWSALKTYKEFIKRGWKPMTIEDLALTTGYVVTVETNRIPKKNNKWRWMVLGATGLVTYLLIA